MLKIIKRFAKNLPGAPNAYDFLKKKYSDYLLKRMSKEDIFKDIYRRNLWGGKHSVSGPGSDRFQTRNIIKELPVLFYDMGISTVLDIPCGDFYWMNAIDLSGIKYIGVDIVKELIQTNKKYEKENIIFRNGNLITDELPTVDLILCRDCFIHFSFNDIYKALENIYKSGSKFLLTTTFIDRTENRDIITGRGRVLNLEMEPFNFPKPLRIIVEDYTLQDRKYTDKSLGLWKIEDIKEYLTKRSN